MQKLVQDKKEELSSSITKKIGIIKENLETKQYSESFKSIIETVSRKKRVSTNVTYAAWNNFLTKGNNQPEYIREIVESILSNLMSSL